MIVRENKRFAFGPAARFLITYIAVLLLPLVMSLTLIRNAGSIVNEQSISNAQSALSQISELIENDVQAVKSNAVSLLFADSIQSLLKNRYEINEFRYRSHKAIASINQAAVSAKYNDVFLVMPYYDYVITRDLRIIMDDFFCVLRIKGNDAREWLDKAFQTPSGSMMPMICLNFNGNEERVIPIVYHSTILYPHTDGLMLFFLREESLIELFKALDIGASGRVYLLNNRNETVLSINDEEGLLNGETLGNMETSVIPVNGKQMQVIACSFGDGMRLIFMSPEDYVLRNVRYVASSYIRFFAIALLLGSIAALLFTRMSVKPWKQALDEISFLTDKNMLAETRYLDIRNSMDVLNAKNTELNEHLRQSVSMMRRAVIDKIINSYGGNADEIGGQLQEIGVSVIKKQISVAVLQIDEYSDRYENTEHARLTIATNLETFFQKDAFVLHYVEQNRILLLNTFSGDCEAFTYFEERIRRFIEQTLKSEDISARAGISDLHRSPEEIPTAYWEALTALNDRHDEDRCVLFNKLVSTGNDMTQGIYFSEYIPSTRKMITEYAVSGNQEALHRLFDRLYQRNVTSGRLSPQMCLVFLNNLLADVLQAAVQSGMVLTLPRLESMGLDEAFQSIEEMANTVAHHAKDTNTQRQNRLTEAVLAEIEAGYRQKDFSLAVVAEKLNYSESHLSHLFTSSMGESIAKYVENKRIELACEILTTNPNCRLRNLAGEVGYVNETTFMRAFKRVKGVAPSEWRPDS